MIAEYQSGTYCAEVKCSNYTPLVNLRIEEYFQEKNTLCRDCTAWNFYGWLRAKEWQISKPALQALPVQLPGFDPAGAMTLSDEEMTAFRSLFC